MVGERPKPFGEALGFDPITSTLIQRPDAVLLDIQLGDEDGLSLVVWMRRQPKLCRVPVIAVTAHAMVTERHRLV